MLSEFRPRSLTTPTRSHLYSHALITNALRLIWVVVVISGELGAFFWSLSGCRWPSIDLGHKVRQKVKNTHVLLIADPQVQHPALLARKSRWASPMRRAWFELNLRKSWHVASRLSPDAVIFLGDMLGNGKMSQNREEYDLAAQKFKSIFWIDSSMSVHYIPGNNDVGLGSVSSVAKTFKGYYEQTFGPLNQRFVISNHTFIGINAPGLVDEDYQRQAKYISFDDWKPIPDGSVSFVKDVAEYGPGHVILLSHIPLSRSETAECGPLREHGSIRRGAGPGYQSMLGKQTTNFLLKSLDPLVIFSADNRDYCEYTHVLPGTRTDGYNRANAIREVTVKSFSMSTHISRPGFQLLSLVDPAKMAHPNLPSLADAPCLLPDQYRIYASFYAPCLCITLFVLIVFNLRRPRPPPLRKLDLHSTTPSPRSSGRNTPNTLAPLDTTPWSAGWSPFSPAVPLSPRSTLPSHLRTPRPQSTSATHLVASLPGSPMPSSPTSLALSLPFSDRGDLHDDDDDTMYPAQYALRRHDLAIRQREKDEWSHVEHQGRDEEEYDHVLHDQESAAQSLLTPSMHQSEFISAPDYTRGPKVHGWSWSYTFVYRGRRRRVSVGLPSWNSLRNLLDLFGFGAESAGPKRRRGGLKEMPMDALSIFWPAIIVWLIINWTILSN